jgi:integrase
MSLLDGLVSENPMIHIKNLPDKVSAPDPLTLNERELILEWLKENEHEIYYHYFCVSFALGARQPSEVSGLWWDSIDFNSNEVLISQRITGGELKQNTKTGKPRTIRLRPHEMKSFKAMKKITGFKNEFVFLSPQGTPFYSPNRNLNLVWRRALKACGIRHHEMRQTRHTAATTWIMAGMNPKLVADRLGDRLDTVITHYSKWLDGQATDDELLKLDAFENQIAHNLRTKRG